MNYRQITSNLFFVIFCVIVAGGLGYLNYTYNPFWPIITTILIVIITPFLCVYAVLWYIFKYLYK